MMPTSVSDLMTLNGGCVVATAVLEFGWRLEERGLTLEIEGDYLSVGPKELLTDEDRSLIRRYRDDLVAILKHCETVQ